MTRTGPLEFIQQVRAEASKVTWPSRRETIVTSAMVVVMAVLASIFFLMSDQVISQAVRFLLGLGASA